MPRAKLQDTKPRGRMSAYAFFVQNCREDHKRKHPDENVVFAEFSRKCADKWKVMDDKDKQKFYELAEKDKHRYDSEMSGYTGPRSTRSRKRRQRKDPNAPKRALSAFFWFSCDERPKVRLSNPDYGAAETAKELGHRWAKIDKDTKDKFEQMALKDRARYDKEMKAYKSGNFGGNPNKKVKTEAAPPVANDEEDDDEDEDEDEEEDDDEDEEEEDSEDDQ